MEQSIKKEPLGKGVVIYASDEYRFGTDAIILANFAAPKRKDLICDLGCGGGIIPMLFLRDELGQKVYAVDIQKNACELCKKAGEENGFDNLEVVESDLRDLKGKLPFGAFNLVTCNPPYKKSGTGIVNPNNARYIARHEAECDINDVCAAAEKLLISHGKLCICQRPERLPDIFEAMRRHRCEPKRLRMVHQRQNTEPWLVLVEGMRDGKAGMRIMPPLYVESDNMDLSEEMKEIYGIYKFGEGEKKE